MGTALNRAVENMAPLEFITPEADKVKLGFSRFVLWLESLTLDKPQDAQAFEQ